MFAIQKADPLSKNSVRHALAEFAAILGGAFAILLMFATPASTDSAINGVNDAVVPAKNETEYRLGPLDKLSIKLSAWRPATAEVFSWEALNGEYSVGANGALSLPLVGEVPAAGTTTVELAREIANRLKERIGLVESPDVSIEIIQFRPIYVVGDVEHPGEFAYRPGMNVLQAMTLAGGQFRAATSPLRLERELITSTGDLHQLEAERLTLLARKARLETEFNDESDIQFPAFLVEARDTTAAREAMAQEVMIFTARKEAFTTQIGALEQLQSYLEKEVVSLEEQIKSHDTELRLVREELDSVQELANKGLASAPRRLGLERNLAQSQGDRLRLESGLMRVKQDISRTSITILELRGKRTNELAVELASVTGRLEEVGHKLETTEKLIYETEVIAPLAERRRNKRMLPVYRILRQRGGTASELSAAETTGVEPGDTIKFELLMPDDFE